MQIYTRTGDNGTTRIIGGQSVYKDDARIHAYGSIDELNSLIGITRSHNLEWLDLNPELLQIQQFLFDCGNDFATPGNKYPYRINSQAITWLEERIDDYADQTPDIEEFIIPGGSKLSSYLHYARTVTRRVERDCVAFIRQDNIYNQDALKFINRLSDYLFAAARLANYRQDINDITYQRSGKVFHTDLTKDRIPK